MTSSTEFLRRLGLRHPLIQAPMAGVSTPRLAAAVSEAGALGSLGLGAGDAAQGQAALRETRQLTRGPLNANVFCHRPAQRDAAREGAWLAHLAPLFQAFGAAVPGSLNEIYATFVGDDAWIDMFVRERPEVVSFHFGLPPADHVQALREAGIYTMATATNLQEAAAIEQAGVDAIVAQGIEAGGHRGMFDPQAPDERHSTFVLVQLLTARSQLPVIAAGGIMDGRGIQAMLDLGAVAAQLGTAFVLCPESAANAGYRDNLRSERSAHTRLTPTLSGRPARGIVNRFITHAEQAGAPPLADYPVAYDAAKQLHAAASKAGNHEFAAHWAGQGAPLARELPAAALVETLVSEMRR